MPTGTITMVSNGDRCYIQPADGGPPLVCLQANTRNASTPHLADTVTLAQTHVGTSKTFERGGDPSKCRRLEL